MSLDSYLKWPGRLVLFVADRGCGKSPYRFHGNIIIGNILIADSCPKLASSSCAFVLSFKMGMSSDGGYRGFIAVISVVNPLLPICPIILNG